ncbi:cobalt-precorrin-6A reductase [Tychonema sp. BBK16]|uniref:cobalt-precorrin-6A reductase n=1 Tax=Tychonema sp. BBK16 TaxID=2699888 RepID=UPI001F29D66C|nr:cobalt-precorrin-6A reductase [Tychonema sp. BBK16]MCF6372865.1 cobalt-precorrin-6A reductase [Tychonema sp. BBK16]
MGNFVKKRLLILGGTGDATELAARASKIANLDVISSLAGRTKQPSTPKTGEVRIGGFGGASGLAEYLTDRAIDFLIDATHPFAAQISANAATAATECGLPHLMLVRPAWQPVEGDTWIEVESHEAAAIALSERSQRVFLTIGRQELTAFGDLDAIWFLMRAIDPPALDILYPHGKLLLAKGPFLLEDERKLLIEYQIDTIVSKNSGGDATYAKIVAARELRIPVVMVQRPPIPAVAVVADVEGAIAWLLEKLN